MTLAIIATFVLFGLWRRWFGMATPKLDAFARRLVAWWPLERKPTSARWLKVAAVVALGFLALWPALPWWGALLGSAVLAAYWLRGHKLGEWTFRDWLLRYGPPGAFWWLANRYPLPARFCTPNGIIDGSNALAEFAAGGTVYAVAGWLAWLAAT